MTVTPRQPKLGLHHIDGRESASRMKTESDNRPPIERSSELDRASSADGFWPSLREREGEFVPCAFAYGVFSEQFRSRRKLSLLYLRVPVSRLTKVIAVFHEASSTTCGIVSYGLPALTSLRFGSADRSRQLTRTPLEPKHPPK